MLSVNLKEIIKEEDWDSLEEELLTILKEAGYSSSEAEQFKFFPSQFSSPWNSIPIKYCTSQTVNNCCGHFSIERFYTNILLPKILYKTGILERLISCKTFAGIYSCVLSKRNNPAQLWEAVKELKPDLEIPFCNPNHLDEEEKCTLFIWEVNNSKQRREFTWEDLYNGVA